MDMPTLIDVNVFEDVARKRRDWRTCFTVLEHFRDPDAEGYVSAWTVAVIYYFREKRLGDARARAVTRKMIRGLTVLDFTSDITYLALDDKRFSDFEDALQFHIAQKNGLEAIVTKNVRDFKVVENEISILKPKEFLAQIEKG
ncbi:MAG: hypothetical protein ISS49_04950 [Anaerolineae bacterium]|nr:hypothetical protein [Anaerolineae bacterium]